MKKALLYALILMLVFFAAILVRTLVRDPLVEVLPTETPTTQTTLGFIRAIEPGHVLVFDEAIWLVGTEAENAAIAAGHCTKATREECLPNGYFIANEDTATRPLPFAPDVEVFLVTYGDGMPDTEEPISLAEFTHLMNDEKLHWNKLPYHVTVRDGVVTKILEQYIP